MSKLSRYKKAPVIKLPKRIPARSSRFDDASDSDDDDFIKPRDKPKQKPKPEKGEEKEALPELPEALPSSLSSSTSEYFPIPTVDERSNSRAKSKKCSSETSKPRIGTGTSETKQEQSSHPPNKNAKNERRKEKPSNSEDENVAIAANSEEPIDEEGKIVCPFCWKKLADKLTGTTHVKSCAKNIPIDRIFEAMQLQEKQIEEWERLGLNFPGFSSGSKKPKTGAGTGTSKGRSNTGTKKKKVTDPDMELALALSASLHEEFESRKLKENQFIIENGLENEVGLAEVKSTLPPTIEASNECKPEKVNMSAPVAQGKRRGKKIQLKDAPLYTVDDERKKMLIEERVANILDETDKNEELGFHIRNELPSNAFSVPKRLSAFQDESSPLWNLAKSLPDTPDETFSVLDLPQPLPGLPMSSERESLLKREKIVIKSEPILSSDEQISQDSALPQPDERNLFKPPKSAAEEVNVLSKQCINRKRISPKDAKTSPLIGMLPSVIQDVAKLLITGAGSDITLYGREEKPLKCHRFMILARCPKLLDEIIMEEKTGKNGILRSRSVIPLTDYCHKSVKALLWYIYTGNLDHEDEECVAEIKEIATAFEMELVGNKEQPSYKHVSGDTRSIEVQTDADVIRKEDSSTMTDSVGAPVQDLQIQQRRSSDNRVTSQELFTTFDGVSVSGSPCQLNYPEEKHIEDEDANENVSNKSVDLFEDIEEDFNETHENQCSPNTQKFNTPEPTNSDDGIILDDLRSPTLHHSPFVVSEKKRSRSVSPLPFIDESNGLYTATQVAEMLDIHQHGGDVKEYIEKAKKKQKLDYSDIELELDLGKSVRECNQIDKKVAAVMSDSDFDLLINDAIAPEKSLVTSYTRFSVDRLGIKRKSVSSPNLCARTNTNFVSFNDKQMNCHTEPDPLENACDDSMFANIPDEIFSPTRRQSLRNKDTLSQGSSNYHSDTTNWSKVDPTPSSSRKRAPRRNLSKNEETSQKNTTLRHPKGNTKKPAAKLKLPSRRPAAQERNAITQPLSTDHIEMGTKTNKSPMLNYSLIDTPILKQELKKFGIKPLPRSKAKVLLRHIHKETH